MTSVVVTLSGDEAQLLRAFNRINQAQDKTDREFDRMADGSKAAAGEISSDMNKVGVNTTKAFNQSIRELRKMGPEGRAAANALEAHLRATGQAGRRDMESIVKALGELDDEAAIVAANAANDLKKVGKAGNQAFGPGAIEKVKAFATAWISVSAAVGMVRTAMAAVGEEQKAALSSLQSQALPERRLAQIAADPGDLDAMINKSDELAKRYGIARDAARELVFSAKSEGFYEDIDFVARASRVVDTASSSKLAGSLGRLFAGEGLNIEQRLSAVLAAAGTSAFDFETVGANVQKSASTTMAAGADMAETLAANATLANMIGDTAGDRIKAFASMASMKPELAGKGLIGSVEAITAMDEETRKKTLGGSMEVNEAYRLMRDAMTDLKTMTAAVRSDLQATGQGGGSLLGKIGIAEGSDRFRQRESVARATIRKEIADERALAADEANYQAKAAEARARATEAGENQTLGALGSMAGATARAVQVDSDRASTLVSMISGDELGRLSRLSTRAAESWFMTEDSSRILQAVNYIAVEMQKNPELDRTSVATFLGQATGTHVAASEVDENTIRQVTQLIDRVGDVVGLHKDFVAMGVPGIGRLTAADAGRMIAGETRTGLPGIVTGQVPAVSTDHGSVSVPTSTADTSGATGAVPPVSVHVSGGESADTRSVNREIRDHLKTIAANTQPRPPAPPRITGAMLQQPAIAADAP